MKQENFGKLLNTFRAMALISLMPFLIPLLAISALGFAIISKQNGQQHSSNVVDPKRLNLFWRKYPRLKSTTKNLIEFLVEPTN